MEREGEGEFGRVAREAGRGSRCRAEVGVAHPCGTRAIGLNASEVCCGAVREYKLGSAQVRYVWHSQFSTRGSMPMIRWLSWNRT